MNITRPRLRQEALWASLLHCDPRHTDYSSLNVGFTIKCSPLSVLKKVYNLFSRRSALPTHNVVSCFTLRLRTSYMLELPFRAPHPVLRGLIVAID